MEGIIFFDNGAHNIKTARAGVHTKNDAVADTVKHAAENRRQHQIVKRRIVIQHASKVQTKRKDYRPDDYVNRIRFAQQFIRRKKQRDVIKKSLQTDGPTRQIIENYRHTGRAAGEQMTRHQK